MNKSYFLILIFIFSSFCLSCNFQYGSNDDAEGERSVSFMTWNTQTFFDGTTEGTEYSEFQKSKNWCADKYKIRLERLCEVLNAINADIIVLQEIENDDVMQDISNMMAGKSWNKKKGWPYGAFSKNENDALGCGIFSRFPITNIKSHCLNVKSEAEKQPSMRPIVEATVNINGKDLVIFINHWKSKSGGEVVTEKWRQWQESVLCRCIKGLENSGQARCVAAGDFNRDIGEFGDCKTKNGNNITLKSAVSKSEKVDVYSPWLNSEGSIKNGIGSYYFQDKWSRIDNIFSWGNIKISDFSPIASEPWTYPDFVPIKYTYYNGKGYSDHLPLFCTLTF